MPRERSLSCRTAAGPPSSAARTMRVPTITPSARSATRAALSGLEIPKPTATGTPVAERTSATVSESSGGSSARSPVVPATETV